MSRPRNVKLPEDTSWSPLTMLKNVVLPAPFGPIRLTMDRSGMSKSTESTATRPPKTLVIPRATSMLVSPARPPSSATGRPTNRLGFVHLLRPLAVGDYPLRPQQHHGDEQDAEQDRIVLGDVRVA